MEAKARDLETIFDCAIQYQIPLFQRPYVWDVEKGWLALWENIEDLLNKQLIRGKVHPHFLGAVVLETLRNATGAIQNRQIIDGQQRFTTLQIVMLACRDLATYFESEKYRERFGDLVCNRENRIDHADEAFKVWPTNSDRPAYRLIQSSGSPGELENQLRSAPALRDSNIVRAYQYFYKGLSDWFALPLEDIDAANREQPTISDRFEALWNVVRASLQLVVIDLDEHDEAQVIFETMNALGEPLLPVDLIKNFLFRQAATEGADLEALYRRYWVGFDDAFWREEIKQGRIFRARVDIFLSYFLALMTQDDVKSTHLFSAFKTFANNEFDTDNKLIEAPTTAAEHMALLARFGQIYRAFVNPSGHTRLATFLYRLEAIDTATVYPFLLLAYDVLIPEDRAEFDKILVVLESFLIRRMVCGFTTKNYNKLFIDLTKPLSKSDEVTAASVAAWLARSKAESQKFPTNEEFSIAVLGRPIYKDLSRFKVRVVLEAVDAELEHSKSEALSLPEGLTIEHVMPQEWTKHWPLPAEVAADPVQAQEARAHRDLLLNSFGNLTLITGSLNPALSNEAWNVKRPELLKFSKLNLTRYFHDDALAKAWDENAIVERGAFLAGTMIEAWPDVEREDETATA